MRGRSFHGRCLPYGEGITYWPVVEVLKQLDVLPSEETAIAAIRSLLGESDDAHLLGRDRLGVSQGAGGAAENAPLVVVFDDIQWGEQTFLDLIEHVALLVVGGFDPASLHRAARARRAAADVARQL